MCARSSYAFHLVTYYIKLVTTSWTYSSYSRGSNITLYCRLFPWTLVIVRTFYSSQILFWVRKKYFFLLEQLCTFKSQHISVQPKGSWRIFLDLTVYSVFKKSCSIFIVYSLYRNWQEVLNIQYDEGCSLVEIGLYKSIVVFH